MGFKLSAKLSTKLEGRYQIKYRQLRRSFIIFRPYSIRLSSSVGHLTVLLTTGRYIRGCVIQGDQGYLIGSNRPR